MQSNHEPFHMLRDALRPVRRRWHAVRVVQAAIAGLWIGSIGSCAVALGRRFGADLSAHCLWAIPLLVATAAAVWRLVCLPNWDSLAAMIDSRYQLKDRTTTALSLAQHDAAGAIDRLQIRDALSHLTRVQPEIVVP